jgi:hypothetical protein
MTGFVDSRVGVVTSLFRSQSGAGFRKPPFAGRKSQNKSRTYPSKYCAIESEHEEDFDGNDLLSLSLGSEIRGDDWPGGRLNSLREHCVLVVVDCFPANIDDTLPTLSASIAGHGGHANEALHRDRDGKGHPLNEKHPCRS